MTSSDVTHSAISAAAPPTAAKYTAGYSCIAAITAGERLPLPIMPRRPCCKSVGVEESMRVEVVGPMEPTGRPGGVGVGPA